MRVETIPGVEAMGLIKPPNILTVLAALALTVAALLARFGLAVPGGIETGFWMLLVASVLLLLGCITRGF